MYNVCLTFSTQLSLTVSVCLRTCWPLCLLIGLEVTKKSRATQSHSKLHLNLPRTSLTYACLHTPRHMSTVSSRPVNESEKISASCQLSPTVCYCSSNWFCFYLSLVWGTFSRIFTNRCDLLASNILQYKRTVTLLIVASFDQYSPEELLALKANLAITRSVPLWHTECIDEGTKHSSINTAAVVGRAGLTLSK